MASGHERYDWGAQIARRVWSSALTNRSLVRALITSVALTAGVLLSGCNSDEISLANNAKANQPVPPKLVADMAEKNMDLQSPMLVRLFKQEAELEVWKQDRAGCFAMTDEQIAEIYSLGRESFFGGQRAFQLQAYPFKMTPLNMARHRNNPNMPFWKMIKEGYDHFEVTRQEPKVEFCEKKYVFDAAKAPDAKRDPVFEASAKCPAYVIPDEIAQAVREKQEQEQAETAKLISKGTPVARTNTGIDGGMNKVFAAKLPDGSTGLSEGGDGQGLSLVALSRAPGTIPSHVNPPRGPVTSPDEPLAAS